MKWFDIPQEFVPKLRKLQEDHSASEIYNFLKEVDAVQMFTTMGIGLYLTFDGRVLVEDYEDFTDTEPIRDAKNFAEVAMAIILGAENRNFPELLTLLPKRPESAADCENCDNKSGWFDLPGLGKFICEHCGGLGWIPKESGKFYE